MARVVNVAELVQPDIELEIPGHGRFVLPGDPPVALWLQITDAADAYEAAEADSVADAIRDLERLLLDLFRIHQPSIDVLPLGIGGMIATVVAIYDRSLGEEEDAAPPPRAGTRSGSSRTQKRSTSRS